MPVFKHSETDAVKFLWLSFSDTQNTRVLQTLFCGKNIKNIDREAFAECSKLSNINMKKAKGITSIGKKAFRKINAKAKVTVPAAKKAKYKNLLKKAGLPKKAAVK